MFNVGGGEILVILLLALIVLGPDKLPDTARKVGRYVNEFRRMTSGFQEEFRQAMDLGASDSKPNSAPPQTSADDAVHRATPGPRLLSAPELPSAPEHPAVTSADGAAAPADSARADAARTDVDPTIPVPGSAPSATSSPSSRAAFAADVTPAPGTGPELVTPPHPAAPTGDGTGSSSAA